MRRLVTVGLGIAATFVAASAFAAPGKGETGGKGGLGPANSTQSGAAGAAEEPAVDLSQAAQTQFGGKSTQNPDVSTGARAEEKPWFASATWETHRLLRQDYLDDGVSKVSNLLFALAGYSLTAQDLLLLSGGMTQVFLADPGEPGVRAVDLSLGYTHTFRLPAKVLLRTSASLTAPISYTSQLESNITSPSGSLVVSRQFGDLLVSAVARGTYFWDKYTSQNSIGAGNGTAGGVGSGSPNVKGLVGMGFSAEYDMPFHRPLSVGLSASTNYSWFYMVGSPPVGTTFDGATSNPQTDNQPWQQSYAGEVYIHYVLPTVAGINTDLQLALANGDQGVGYVSTMLNTGIVHPYLLYYNQADVYFALSARY